jgi:hypothetical protein
MWSLAEVAFAAVWEFLSYWFVRIIRGDER